MMNANHDPLAHLATKEALATVAARLDATLPHLATKADFHELNSRIHQMGNRLLFWLTGTLVTCLLTFYGLHSSMMESQRQDIQELRQELRQSTQELRQSTQEQHQLTESIAARLQRMEENEARRPPPDSKQ